MGALTGHAPQVASKRKEADHVTSSVLVKSTATAESPKSGLSRAEILFRTMLVVVVISGAVLVALPHGGNKNVEADYRSGWSPLSLLKHDSSRDFQSTDGQSSLLENQLSNSETPISDTAVAGSASSTSPRSSPLAASVGRGSADVLYSLPSSIYSAVVSSKSGIGKVQTQVRLAATNDDHLPERQEQQGTKKKWQLSTGSLESGAAKALEVLEQMAMVIFNVFLLVWMGCGAATTTTGSSVLIILRAGFQRLAPAIRNLLLILSRSEKLQALGSVMSQQQQLMQTILSNAFRHGIRSLLPVRRVWNSLIKSIRRLCDKRSRYSGLSDFTWYADGSDESATSTDRPSSEK